MKDTIEVVFADSIGQAPGTTYLSLFPERRWSISEPISVEDVVPKLIDFTWTLCTAFRVELGDKHILLFNMSFTACPTRHQEYSVLAGDSVVESLTVSAMTRERLTRILHSLLKEAPSLKLSSFPTHDSHTTCELCG